MGKGKTERAAGTPAALTIQFRWNTHPGSQNLRNADLGRREMGSSHSQLFLSWRVLPYRLIPPSKANRISHG
jgi:hypothetical protein